MLFRKTKNRHEIVGEKDVMNSKENFVMTALFDEKIDRMITDICRVNPIKFKAEKCETFQILSITREFSVFIN